MKRTTDLDRVINKHGVGRDGFADEVVDGDEIVTPGTIVDESWLDHVQEELARAIELLGGTLNAANLQQLGEILLAALSVALGAGTLFPSGLRVVPYLIANAAYSGLSFSVASQGTAPEAVAFSSDGTKMYVLCGSNDTVFQYTLSTAWRASTATYSGLSLSVSAQEQNGGGLAFSSDGTKMYVVGQQNDTVYQYTLPTPWSLSGASYASLSLSVAAQETAPKGLAFSSDGTKMYVVGTTNATVYRYTLPTPWSLSGASYASSSFSVAAQDALPNDIAFSSDGLTMFVYGQTNDTVYEYSLPTAWILTSASYKGISYNVLQETTPYGLAFSADGTKMYVTGNNQNTVFQYYTSRVVAA